jgi:hypothetical protein
MADIQIKAAYGSVVEEDEDALLFIAFAEGEDEDGSYVVLQQPLEGGPVRLEVNDENFAAEDALESVTLVGDDLLLTIRATKTSKFGFAGTILIGLAGCEDRDDTLAALRGMLGPIFA